MTFNRPTPVDQAKASLLGAASQLRSAVADGNIDGDVGLLEPLANSLQWIYYLDVHLRQRDGSSYFTVRSGSTAGKTTGALTWVRGIQVHHLIEPAEMAQIHPSQTLLPGDHLVPGEQRRWQFLHLMPQPDPKTTAYDRDEWYRELVEQHPVMQPIEEAVDFLLSKVGP